MLMWGLDMIFKKLAQKLAIERQKHSNVAINPINVDFDNRERKFLNKLSKSAVDMYERQTDIKKFTNLVLSNPENKSHNKLVDELFNNGVLDPSEEEKLVELSDNRRFLRDLGFID